MRIARALVVACLTIVLIRASAAPAAQHAPKSVAHPPVASARKVEFLRDIAPILARSGCSVAACHGKFGGRGGMQLSLLTLSPEDDYSPLVYGARGRRVNFAAPEKSLVLLKATSQVPHGGGERFAVGSPQYSTLLRWIRQGAPFDDKDPRIATFKLMPDRAVVPKAGKSFRIRAVATYTDGSTREVTSQTVFDSSNAASFAVTQAGVVTGVRWGGGAILARYLGSVSACFVTLPQARKGPYAALKADNVIDRLVFDNLKRMNVLPSAHSGDLEFLRRVTIDVAGRLPLKDEMAAFEGDKEPNRRAKVIDRLLDSPEFVDVRSLQLSDLLRVNPRKLGYTSLADRSALLFYDWIHRSVAANKPWDQFVREIVTARGSDYQYGPAAFYRIEQAPNDRMENVSQAFLGVRMACARCHKHPFDRWTTDDYWNFAAFCDKVSSQGGKLVDETIIGYNRGAALRNQSVIGKSRGKVAPPTYLGDKSPAPDQPDEIAGLAKWITNPANPFFARATVNRLWSYYFGRGLVHPVDDMRVTTPESVPGVLDALAKELVDSKYDVKHVIRLILNSQTYQLSSLPNASNRLDDKFCSRSMPRSVPAQVILDMVNQATGATERFGTFPDRARAVQAELPPSTFFLTAFGQSHRDFLADIDPKLEPNLVQTLHMINGPYIEQKVRNGRTGADAVKESPTDDALVQDLFLRTFCRRPSATESAKSIAVIKGAKNRNEGAQDLLWALIASREFYFNH